MRWSRVVPGDVVLLAIGFHHAEAEECMHLVQVSPHLVIHAP